MTKPTHSYIMVQTPGSKKIEICSRRVGTKERYTCMAFTTSEEVAGKVIEALDAYQGVLDKIDAPSAVLVADLRASMNKQIDLHKKDRERWQEDTRNLRADMEKVRRELLTARTDNVRLENEAARLRREFAEYSNRNPEKVNT